MKIMSFSNKKFTIFWSRFSNKGLFMLFQDFLNKYSKNTNISFRFFSNLRTIKIICWLSPIRAELKIVDIEIIAESPLYVNLKIILIFSLYPGKFLKFNQSELCVQNPEQSIRNREIWNFAHYLIKEFSLVGIR